MGSGSAGQNLEVHATTCLTKRGLWLGDIIRFARKGKSADLRGAERVRGACDDTSHSVGTPSTRLTFPEDAERNVAVCHI